MNDFTVKFTCAFTLMISLIAGNAMAQNAQDLSQIDEKESEAMQRFGYAAAAVQLQGGVRLVAPEMEMELQRLVDELALAAETGIKHQVYVMNNPQANMFTLPTGEIFVFSGFIDKVENRDELAFGLAHEIAHFKLKHSQSKLRNSMKTKHDARLTAQIVVTLVATATGTAAASAVYGLYSGSALGAPFFGLFASQIGSYVARISAKVPIELITQATAGTLGRFSQANEFEADRHALLIMSKAGYNPDVAPKLIAKLHDLWHRRTE